MRRQVTQSPSNPPRFTAMNQKMKPDTDRISELLALQRRLNQERHGLRIDDDAAVRKAIENYSKIVRAGQL
ncbi:hypothetical protein WS62_17790 [Burkholderia sp. ABCPW 14]|nr:hypothetical protein WS62_17790 [Burkholderia sp. ABCPW 14]